MNFIKRNFTEIITVLGVICIIYMISLVYTNIIYERGFNDGAYSIVRHHSYKGNYGSEAYRDYIIKTKEIPQSDKDVQKILNYLDSISIDIFKD